MVGDSVRKKEKSVKEKSKSPKVQSTSKGSAAPYASELDGDEPSVKEALRSGKTKASKAVRDKKKDQRS